MKNSKAYVITAMQSWNATAPGDARQMAMALSHTAPVLYVNPPIDLLALLGRAEADDLSRKNRVLRGSEPAIRHVARGLWVLEPPLILTPPMNLYSEWVFDLFNRHNNRRYADVIAWALKSIGLEPGYLMIDNDIFRSLYLDDYLAPELTVYYRRGNFPGFDYWRKHRARLERELMQRCDLVAATSDYLAGQLRGMNDHAFNIGHGVDLEGFVLNRHDPLPEDMRGIRPPVIGCTGVLRAGNTSADLLYRLARTYAGCSIVLVGGEDAAFARHPLHRLGNVYFLGEKPAERLPAYIRHFDVCISPEAANELTSANYPDCVLHYLSLGKNVVATATGALEEFRGAVMLAGDQMHFLALVGLALGEPADWETAHRRAEYARGFTWEASAERLRSLIGMMDGEFYRVDGSCALPQERLS